MKKLLILLCCFISFNTYADTISFWKVYHRGVIIKEGAVYDTSAQIFFNKGKILAKDSLLITYFDDTPCPKCASSLIIKTRKGKIIREIMRKENTYSFKIATTDLQLMTFNNRSNYLKFYFKEHETDKGDLLLEIVVR